MAIREWLTDSERDEGLAWRGFQAFLVGAAAWVVSLFYSWQEIRYLLHGEMTAGRILDTYRTSEVGLRLEVKDRLAVQYAFMDASTGKVRKELCRVADGGEFSGDELTVEYLPGIEGKSRPPSYGRPVTLVISFGGFAALVGFWVAMHRLANAPFARRRAPRRVPSLAAPNRRRFRIGQ